MPRAIAVSTPVHGGPEETLWSIAREARRLVDRLERRAVRTASAILRAPSRTPRTVPEDRASQLPKTLEQRSDEDLLILHREGDPQALRLLIERYSGELHGFLTRLVGSRAGADDVFQEAFLQVHLSAESFDRERRFKPWLYTIAANKGRDFLRRQRRRHAVSLDAPVASDSATGLVDLLASGAGRPTAALEDSDERGLVKQVVDEMPPHFREILLLAYFQKLSYSQIADSLSIPLGTVKSRLHAAVASFAQSWKLACERRGLPMPRQDTLDPDA
jgi:RNA polymerase sigma-70 factor (ECF subfamily)